MARTKQGLLWLLPLSGVCLVCQDAASTGVNLVRFWGFSDGPTVPPSDAIQPTVRPTVQAHTCSLANSLSILVPGSADHAQVGVFNEAALQRFDLVLSEAAKNSIKVIFPLVDGDNYLGGPQWYFDQARTACGATQNDLFSANMCLLAKLEPFLTV